MPVHIERCQFKKKRMHKLGFYTCCCRSKFRFFVIYVFMTTDLLHAIAAQNSH